MSAIVTCSYQSPFYTAYKDVAATLVDLLVNIENYQFYVLLRLFIDMIKLGML